MNDEMISVLERGYCPSCLKPLRGIRIYARKDLEYSYALKNGEICELDSQDFDETFEAIYCLNCDIELPCDYEYIVKCIKKNSDTED
jgi:hypothetical protein